MSERNCLILTQYRKGGEYNDFIGKYYHFPASTNKSYLKQFEKLPIEFVYFEPEGSGGQKGKGEFYGYGKIKNVPFSDKREQGNFFVEISDYHEFAKPVFYKNEAGKIIESEFNLEHYNPQNAVRKIDYTLLDKLCLDGGILLNFNADAHLVQVLGEQLIESEKVGILELIKNSLDAGASYCKVSIENLPNFPLVTSSVKKYKSYEGPVIVIEDDGIGMSREEIENGWLRPATTIKTNIKERLREEKKLAFEEGKLSNYESLLNQLKAGNRGRIPLGEKGVGRFATHRLGRHLELRTKTSDIDYELVLKINWDDFETDLFSEIKDLNSIPISLTREKLSRKYNKNDSGTKLIIYGGKKYFQWDKELIKDINHSVRLLNSPNPDPERIQPAFAVFFDCPQVSDLAKEPLYLDFKPNFSYEGRVDSTGILVKASIIFSPPKNIPLPSEVIEYENYDLKVGDEYWLSKSEPQVGGFYFHFDIWYRDKEWVEGPDSKNLFDYLEAYGGISLYRDNVLILPAEWANKTDWYGLKQKQIKQAYRLSYYHMVGNIEFDQLENPDLIDKTSREGLIENRAFKDLRQLVIAAVTLVEQSYISFRDKYTSLTKGITRDPAKLNDTVKQQRTLLRNINDKYPMEEDPYSLFHELVDNVSMRRERIINLDDSLKHLKESLELMEEVQDLLKEKAAYGISVAVSVHEIAKITANFYYGISEMLNNDGDVIDRIKLEELQKSSASLQSELKRLSPLRALRNEKPSEFGVVEAITFASDVFKSRLEDRNIIFELEVKSDIQIFARYGALTQVFTNLFDNSTYWLQFSKETRIIRVIVDDTTRTVIFADNGPGISPAIRNHLFEAGYSLKVPPSGLGLYICKYYMHSIQGDIYETHGRERIPRLEKGAQFTIDFEKVPTRKEKTR